MNLNFQFLLFGFGFGQQPDAVGMIEIYRAVKLGTTQSWEIREFLWTHNRTYIFEEISKFCKLFPIGSIATTELSLED
jgi:hypothetical protein